MQWQQILKDHIKQQVDAWKCQTPLLATAYLQWKCFRDPVSEIGGQEPWTIDIMPFTCSYAFPPVFCTAYFFLPHTDLTTHQFSHSAEVLYTNETLLLHSFLGTTPEKPTLPFFLELLEIIGSYSRFAHDLVLMPLQRHYIIFIMYVIFFPPCFNNV